LRAAASKVSSEGLLDLLVGVGDQPLQLAQRGLQIRSLALEFLDVLERLRILLLRQRVHRAELLAPAIQALEPRGQTVPFLVAQRRLRRRRLELVPRIAREYRRLYNQSVGIVEATATSAAPLDDRELRALQERLENMTNKRVELTTAVDPRLLGGIQVRIGDMLLDGSVRGRLERLREQLVSGAR